MKNFERYLYLSVMLVLSVIVLIDRLSGCKEKCPPCNAAPSAVAPVKTHTIYKPAPVTIYPSAPVANRTAPVQKKSALQPLASITEYTYQHPATDPCPPAASEYFTPEQTRIYDTTVYSISGKDTVGRAGIRDSVRGEILSRRLAIVLTPIYQPPVQIPAKKRNQFKLGFEIGGMPKDWFSLYSGQAAFEMKNDNAITGRVTRIGNQTYYSAGYLWTIKTNKK